MKKIVFISAIAVLGIFAACKKEKTSATTSTTTTTKTASSEASFNCTESVTYTATIKPIFEAKCMPCHTGEKPAHRIDLLQLSGAQAAVAHNLMCTITPGGPCPKMPPTDNKLTETEVKTIECWINNGMKN